MTQLWTLGQDQDQTAIDREILAPFFDQYDWSSHQPVLRMSKNYKGEERRTH